MRLWHIDLVPALPRMQLLGQHRECCALRGKGWGRSHSFVNFAFTYDRYYLYNYHMAVMEEMKNRGYKPFTLWTDPYYRGKTCNPEYPSNLHDKMYPEMDDAYLVTDVKDIIQRLTEDDGSKYSVKDRQRIIEFIDEKGTGHEL